MKHSTLLAAAWVMLCGQLMAATPTMVNYQGRITSSSGIPVANGTYTVVFSIYDVPNGGSPLWTETQSVISSNGLVSVPLGSTVPLTDAVFSNPHRYLGIKVGADPEMVPRIRLLSVPYADRVSTLDGAFGGMILGNTTFQNNLTVSGDVGIGTTSPGKRLTVAGSMEIGTHSADYQHLRIGGGNSSGFLYGSYARYGDGIHLGYNFYALPLGGWTIPNGGGGTSRLSLGYGYIGMYTTNGPYEPTWPSLYIASTGRVGVYTNSPAYEFDVAGSAHATSFPTSSDNRLKENISPLTGVLEKLKNIRGVSFDWNETYRALGRSSGHREIGVIAQEVEKQFPELVTTWGEEHYRAVDYGRLSAVLIEAIKEQQKQIEKLSNKIAEMEKDKSHAGK